MVGSIIGSGSKRLSRHKQIIEPEAYTAKLAAETKAAQHEEKKSEEAVRAAREKNAKTHQDAEATKAFWAFAKKMLVEQGFSSGSEEKWFETIQEELKSNPDVAQGLQSLSQRKHFFSTIPVFKALKLDKPLHSVCSLRTSVSPGILICTNAPLKSMLFIDPVKTKSLQSVIDKALSKHNLLENRLSVHWIKYHDTLHPVVVHHAIPGKDNESTRFLEILVRDDIIDALLLYHKNVHVIEQTYEKPYKQNLKNGKLLFASEDGHLVWSSGFRNMINSFKHKITAIALAKNVKPGKNTLDDNAIHLELLDGFRYPQMDEDDSQDQDLPTNLVYTVRRKLEEDTNNSHVLDSCATPSEDDVGSRNAPYEAVSLETQDMVLAAIGSVPSTKGKKALEEVYQTKALKECKTEEPSDKPLYEEVKPEVLMAQREATIQLYILATNEFLKIETEEKAVVKKFAKNTFLFSTGPISPTQKNALKNFREIISKPLDRDSFDKMFLTPDSKVLDQKSLIAFTTALNNVIKSQVENELKPDTGTYSQKNPVALAWQNALDQWINPTTNTGRAFKSFKQYLKFRAANTKYRAGMRGPDLRALSAIPTQSGAYNPLSMLFMAFGCARSSFNNSNKETRRNTAMDRLWNTAQRIADTSISSEQTGFYAAFDDDDEESNLKHLSESLPQMIKNLFGFLKLCYELSPYNAKSVEQRHIDLSIDTNMDTECNVADEFLKTPKFPKSPIPEPPPFNLPIEVQSILGDLESRHSVALVKLADDDNMQSLPRSTKAQYIIQKDMVYFRQPDTDSAKPLPRKKPKLSQEFQKHFREFKCGVPRNAGIQELKLIRKYTGHSVDSKKWPVEDKAKYILFSHFLEGINQLRYFALKNSLEENDRRLKKYIDKMGKAIIKLQEAKTVYALHKKSGADKKNIPIDWHGLEKKVAIAKKTIIRCSKKIENLVGSRTTCQKWKIAAFALGGIALIGGGATVLTLMLAFGGLAPLSAGLATYGIYLTVAELSLATKVTASLMIAGGIVSYAASKLIFLNTLPQAQSFAKQIKNDALCFDNATRF